MREWYITNSYGVEISFNAGDPFRLTNIEGLGVNNVSFSESQTIHAVGTTISASSVEGREITLEGDMKSSYANRRKLLDTLLPDNDLIFRVVDKEADVDHYIKCQVKKSPEISEDQEVYKKFQFVLYASYPYWRDNKESIVAFVTYSSGFKFKRSFSNTVPWKVGSRDVNQLTYAVNKGSDKTGFLARFETTGYVKGPEILKVLTQENIKFPNLEMGEGDVLLVSTYENERYCKLISNGIEKNIYYLMDDDSNFFVLDKGSNAVRFDAVSNIGNLYCTISFSNTYVGE